MGILFYLTEIRVRGKPVVESDSSALEIVYCEGLVLSYDFILIS